MGLYPVGFPFDGGRHVMLDPGRSDCPSLINGARCPSFCSSIHPIASLPASQIAMGATRVRNAVALCALAVLVLQLGAASGAYGSAVYELRC